MLLGSIDLVRSLTVENHLVQVGKMRGYDEWYVFVDGERYTISEAEYKLFMDDEEQIRTFTYKYIQ